MNSHFIVYANQSTILLTTIWKDSRREKDAFKDPVDTIDCFVAYHTAPYEYWLKVGACILRICNNKSRIVLLEFIIMIHIGSIIIFIGAAVTVFADFSFSIRLPGAAGSGPFEAVKDWIAAFTSKYPEADLSISSVGSGAAQSALWGDINCAKKRVQTICDLIEAGEATGVGENQTLWGIGGGTIDSNAYIDHSVRGLQQLPALGGPVCPVYSKDVTGNLGTLSNSDDDLTRLNMSFPVLSGIFNGTIIRWNHPLIVAENPALVLPSERITVVVRDDKSGMSQTYTEAIKHATSSWPPDAVGKTPD